MSPKMRYRLNKKHHKVKLRAKKQTKLQFGPMGIIYAESGYTTLKELEAARIVLKRKLERKKRLSKRLRYAKKLPKRKSSTKASLVFNTIKKVQIKTNARATICLYRKSKGARMGKGPGKFKKKLVKASKNFPAFEIRTIRTKKLSPAEFKSVSTRLSIKTKIFYKSIPNYFKTSMVCIQSIVPPAKA